MIRTRSLAISIATVLAILVAWTTSGLAESLPTLTRDDATWQSRRPTDQDVPLHGNSWAPVRNEAIPAVENSEPANAYGGAAWQPSESANVVPRPAPATTNSNPNGPAKQTRWIAPNGSTPRTAADNSPVAAGKAINSQNADARAKNNADRTAAREPQQFVPPTSATRLSDASVRGNSEPMPRRPIAQASLSSSPAVRPTARTKSSTSAAQTSDSAAPIAGGFSIPRDQSDRDQLSAAPSPPQSQNNPKPPKTGSASSKHFANDGGWIRPLRQVAYQTNAPMNSNPAEMELPDPNMPGGGQWIGGMPDGAGGDGSCGPSCPCDGAYSCDSGCPCDGGPACCDGCEPGCADEPGCGCSEQKDLFCVGWGDDESCHTIRMRVPRFQEVTIDAGVHGFKGPMDKNPFGGQAHDSGNFGFQEGFNIGAKVPFLDWGYQLGYEATQSELSGDANTGTDHSFSQSFVTGGVFHRSPNGIQGGAAWDWLHDERSNGIDLAQLRTELSLVTCGCHECGAMASFHMNDRRFTIQATEDLVRHTTMQATNQYLLFYRMHGCRGGEGRVFGGVDDDSDGIVGADFLLPMQGCWSLQSEFTYLIPDESSGVVGSQQEAWNLAINLVWHWKGHARECHSNPYRPLFNVADNGSFIVDDRP
jgi:Family of unknown function (DUF6666)